MTVRTGNPMIEYLKVSINLIGATIILIAFALAWTSPIIALGWIVSEILW